MRIHLAPMEGVVDHTMRDMLTRVGGIDRCVTEFVRVTDQRLPERVFYRYCPELRTGGLTPSGVPVYLQLLGGQPEFMAFNANKAARLGAPGIDLNFGCPAKQVNKSDGGSVILREPERVYRIVHEVRQAVPAATPVTVKIRLGYTDQTPFPEVADSVIAAGADELTVHARTKVDGYKPPAYWAAIDAVRAVSPIPVYANGEIWTPADYRDCVRQSGCEDVMLGRGLLACPDLARQIKSHEHTLAAPVMSWLDVIDLLVRFSDVTADHYEPRYVGNRVKQWLGYLRRHYTQAAELFESIKRLRRAEEIAAGIERHRQLILNEHCPRALSA